MKKYDVVIIGAGTSGLTARREVSRKTDNYIVVDDGPLGTTCARVGCMPSKVLIQVANDYHRRFKLSEQGIQGGELIQVDSQKVMSHVRSLRDRFVRGVTEGGEEWKDKLVRGRAYFVNPNQLKIGNETVSADKIIVATGSRPIVPPKWIDFKSHLIDTNEIFELETLPKSLAVIGLGVIGIELGQALHRIGIDVVPITVGKSIGGVTEPELQEYIFKKLSEEMPIHFNGAELIGINKDNQLEIQVGNKVIHVEKALISVGRKPNIDNLGIENIGVPLNERGLPEVDINTLALKSANHIFLPGDVNGDRPLLHEAADEGVIAGHNSVHDNTTCFKRRTPLGITFSDPNIATVGKRHNQLLQEDVDFITGSVSFEGQGRSIVKLKEIGKLHIYANKHDGKILGAEMMAPDGEHIAHLISWAISLNLDVYEALKLPFYHPVTEEGLRTALRDAAKKIDSSSKHELFRCQDPPIR